MYYIGLDIGGTKCAAVLGIQQDGQMVIREKIRFATQPLTPQQVIAEFVRFIAVQQEKHEIAGIGISCGGPLNSSTGVILSPPNLPGWDKIAIVEHLRERFGVPVALRNDADACAMAEWKYGAGRGCKHMIFLTFGTGLGAGLILNGQLYSGACDMAGEVGHVRLSRSGPIGYGKAGSFEGFCSGSGLAQLGRAAAEQALAKGEIPELYRAAGSMEGINAQIIAQLAMEGDRMCRRIYRDCGRRLGQGLSILIDILNPEKIVIGSIYTRCEQLLKDSAWNVIEKECLSYASGACTLSPAQLGESLGDIAALAVATEYR